MKKFNVQLESELYEQLGAYIAHYSLESDNDDLPLSQVISILANEMIRLQLEKDLWLRQEGQQYIIS